MKPLLCFPDPNPLAEDLLRTVLSFGFVGVRVDVSENHDLAWAQARSLAAVPECFPVFLLFGGTMTRHDGEPWKAKAMLDHVADQLGKLVESGFVGREIAIEIGNEPDLAHKLWKKDPKGLGEVYSDAVSMVLQISERWHCLSPSISNLDSNSLDYLEQMDLPDDAEIAFHRYPAGRDFWVPQEGSRGRQDEVDRLKKIANGRKLWNTETGWAERNRHYTLTPEEVAERMADEVRYWMDVGVESFCAYQINDGVLQKNDGHDARRLKTYGFRTTEGTWKPVAHAVKEALA